MEMEEEEIKKLSIELKHIVVTAQQNHHSAWFTRGYCFHLYAQQYEALHAYQKAFQYYKVATYYWVRAIQHNEPKAKKHFHHAYLCQQAVDTTDPLICNTLEHIQPVFPDIHHQFKFADWLWQQGEQQRALDLFEIIANQGYPNAQYFMYEIYSQGQYKQKNTNLAIHWLHKAAWRNYPQAQYTLSQFYHEKNQYETTVNWLLKAIKQQDSENYHYRAQQQLIQYAEQNSQYIDILEKKASGGDTQAIRLLALLYKQAKNHLEDMMALFAHKLRAPLQHIEHNIKNTNNPQQTLRDVESMQRFLHIYSFISSHGEQLQNQLLQDNQGQGRLEQVLKRSLVDAVMPLLSSGNRLQIKQHYLNYAKVNQYIPTDTKLRQWDSNYLHIGKQLQGQWAQTFFDLTATSHHLSDLQTWFLDHFFYLKIKGFDNKNIQFKPLSITEELLVTLCSEILLNMIKYYQGDAAAHLTWYCEPNQCRLEAVNPTTQFEQKLDKGSQKGQDSLLSIARKMGGDFQTISNFEYYKVVLTIPSKLLINKE